MSSMRWRRAMRVQPTPTGDPPPEAMAVDGRHFRAAMELLAEGVRGVTGLFPEDGDADRSQLPSPAAVKADIIPAFLAFDRIIDQFALDDGHPGSMRWMAEHRRCIVFAMMHLASVRLAVDAYRSGVHCNECAAETLEMSGMALGVELDEQWKDER